MTDCGVVGQWVWHGAQRLLPFGLGLILITSVLTVSAGSRPGDRHAAPRLGQVVASPVSEGEDAHSGNLVRNGGFEEDLAYWFVEGQAVPSPRDPHAGSVALRVGSAEGYADQRVVLEPGVTYRLSVWGTVDRVGDVGYVGLSFRNAAHERLPKLEPPLLTFTKRDYGQQSLDFTVDASVASVTLYVFKDSGPARFFVDDIVMVPLDPAIPTGSPVASPSPG